MYNALFSLVLLICFDVITKIPLGMEIDTYVFPNYNDIVWNSLRIDSPYQYSEYMSHVDMYY